MVAAQVSDDSPRQDLEALWRATQDRLKASVPDSTYRLWLEPLSAAGADDDTLYLTAPEGIRAWAERRYSSLIAEALREAGAPLARVGFVAETDAVPGPTATAGSTSTPTTPSTASSSAPATGSPTAPLWPSPRPPPRPTTRSSSTALPGSARPTC